MYYVKNPLYVTVLNPINKKNIQTHFFLGNISDKILKAAQNGKFDETLKTTEWNKNDQDILKDFYGKSWKKKLTTTDLPVVRQASNTRFYEIISGGDDFNMFSNLEVLNTDNFDTPIDTLNTPVLQYSDNTSKNIYNSLSIYPEDNLYEIRLKIQLVTNIPVCRQFIFYYSENELYYTYMLYINKIAYNISWMDMLNHYSDIVINGLSIDMFFEKNKDQINIKSYEKHILAELRSKKFIQSIYVIDLQFFIQEFSLYKITDKYQFELIYYGFIIKYYPQLTIDAFRILLSNPEKIYKSYPLLAIPNETLYRIQMLEQSLINNVYSFDETEVNYSVNITASNIIVYPDILKLNVNIRNIFDHLVLNSKINTLCINFRCGIRKQYVIYKYHVSVINDPIDISIPPDSLAISINDDNKQFIIVINRMGEYRVQTYWLENDNITYDNIIANIANYVNEVITTINNFGILAFPTNGNFKLIDKNVIFGIMSLSIFYKCTLTLHDFNGLKNEFKKYEEAGIIRPQGIQDNRFFGFIFFKGIVDKPNKNNDYSWLYLNMNRSHRTIRLMHKINKIQIEINNIHNIQEFHIIKRFLLFIISNFIKSNKLDRLNKEIVNTKVKHIRKLRETDPDLFNLTDYGNYKPYSILCQSDRQPLIYNENEVRMLSLTEKNKLYHYWNFTHDIPAYYSCKGRYPNLNFITDKHPKGYCLPCCKKLKDIPGTKIAKINKNCLEKRSYKEVNNISQYVLTYGKYLIPGRKSYIPPLLKVMLPNHYIYKLEQVTDIHTNIGFISSIKFVLGDNVITELANIVKTLNSTYYVLANGLASKYSSANELYLDIIENFVNTLSPFIINIDMPFWQHLFVDLIRIKYDIEIGFIVNNNSTISLDIYQETLYKNRTKIVFLMKDNENGINPIIDNNNNAILDAKPFDHLFKPKQFVPSLEFMIEFAKKVKLKIKTLYINLKNLCYAILIDNIFLPVLESVIVSGYNISYDIYPVIVQTLEELHDMIDMINKYKKNSITVHKYLIDSNNFTIGFESTLRLRYYHKPSDIKVSNTILVKYDPREVNREILSRKTIMDISHKGLTRQYYNNLYKLFLAEFSSLIVTEKNINIRNNIKKAIMNITVFNSKEIDKLLQTLYQLLKEYPEDIKVFEEFFNIIYEYGLDFHDIIKFIDHSSFEFDNQWLKQLQESETDISDQVKAIMTPYIEIGNIDNIPHYFNTYTSCIEQHDQFFCKGSKIIIPEEKLKDLYDALILDIKNKSKKYIILTAKSGIFDYFNFIRRPYEYIEIRN